MDRQLERSMALALARSGADVFRFGRRGGGGNMREDLPTGLGWRAAEAPCCSVPSD